MGFHLLGSPSTRHVGKRARGWAVSEGQSQDKQLGGWLNFYTKECLEVKPWPPTLSNQLCQVTVAGKGRRSCTESNERAPDFKKSKAKWVSTLDSGIQIVTVLHHPPRSKSASIADYLESPPSPPLPSRRPHRAISTLYYFPHTASEFLPTQHSRTNQLPAVVHQRRAIGHPASFWNY